MLTFGLITVVAWTIALLDWHGRRQDAKGALRKKLSLPQLQADSFSTSSS